MDKCVACHYYDRQNAQQTDTRGIAWGQCRRSAPHLHPVNQKSFMIEGVWPHVRDDDWCGEWKAGAVRRSESRPVDFSATGPLMPAAGANPFGTRPAPSASPSASVSPFNSNANASPAAASSFGALRSTGRGD